MLYKGEFKQHFVDYASGEYQEMYDILSTGTRALTDAEIAAALPQLTDDMSLLVYALGNSVPEFLRTKSTDNKTSMLDDYSVFRTDDSNRTPQRNDDVSDFHRVRRETIINLIVETLTEKMNNQNRFAEIMGITYEFYLPTISDDEWVNAVDDVSIMAFVQGIPTGHDTYYNDYALGATRIVRTSYIYGTTNKLYHTPNCTHIIDKLDEDGFPTSSEIDNMFLNEVDAALAGYFPCMGNKVYKIEESTVPDIIPGSPSPTYTPTPTPVATATPVPTPIVTATPVPTPIVTSTPVPTPTSTPTPVPTPIITYTPVPTPTPTPTPDGCSQ